jgi:hypothetical protein
VEEPTITMSKKGTAGLEFNKEHVHYFFRRKRIVHCEFVPLNTTVNSDFYCDVLRSSRENVRRNRTELWRNQNWLLHHDNAHVHTSLKTTEFVTNNMVIVPHPPYSSDLTPCDFASFPKLKMKLKGRSFETASDIQRESQAVLDRFKENDFHGDSEVWKHHGIAVYRPKETILKEMAAKISKLSQHFSFDPVRELSDTPRMQSLLSSAVNHFKDSRLKHNFQLFSNHIPFTDVPITYRGPG